SLADTGQHIVLEDLHIQLADHTWHADGPGEMTLAAGQIHLKQLKLVHDHEALELSGEMRGDQLHNVQLQAANLDLGALRRLVPVPALAGDRATARIQL